MYSFIDEFYVYDRALNSAEINQVKNDTDGIPSVSGVVSSDALFQNTNAQITNVLNANNVSTTVSLNWGDSPTLLNTVALGTITGNANQTFVTDLKPNQDRPNQYPDRGRGAPPWGRAR